MDDAGGERRDRGRERRRRLWTLHRAPGAAAGPARSTQATIASNWTAPGLRLTLAAEGRAVAVVSGGDPGVFAMAAAVFEAIEDNPAWLKLDIAVAPGVSAMQAAAARLGAPLGHDFCAISLSDNLKPWAIVERRLKAAAEGDFVIALYNPASKARPDRIVEAFDLLRRLKARSDAGRLRPRRRPRRRKAHPDDARRSGREPRRHGDAHRHRLERDALHRSRRRAALDGDAALLRGAR